MSAQTSLEYADAVRFLEYVHRTFHWDTFLLKNTFGLTPGHEPIPATHHRHGITVDINDLKSLAYRHAQGKVSHEHIHTREREFMNKMQKTKSGTEMLDNDDIQSTSVAMRLDSAIDNVALLGQALHTINLALGTVGQHTERRGEELEALRRVTENYAKKAYEIVDSLQDIHEEAFSDNEFDELNITDEELETLADSLTEAA